MGYLWCALWAVSRLRVLWSLCSAICAVLALYLYLYLWGKSVPKTGLSV
jgi:hypothetical protein